MRRRAFLTGSAVTAGAVGVWAWTRRGASAAEGRITLSADLSVPALPAERAAEIWAVVRIAATAPAGVPRPPINVGLVVDASSSMQGDAIAAARTAAGELIDALQDGDRLTIVSFGSTARRTVDGVVLDDETRAAARDAVAAIVAEGTTDLGGGLDQALSSLERFAAAGTVSRLVLLSDGVPNDPTVVPALVHRASSTGISITSLGFGLDYDEVLLEQLARDTGGAFAFVDAPDEIGPTFVAETRRLQGVLAKDLRLLLVPGPRCRMLVIDGVVVDGNLRRHELSLGDLGDGEERVVAVRMLVEPHRDGVTAELLDATIGYTTPASGQLAPPQSVFLSAPVTDDDAVLAAAIPAAIQQEVERARAAQATLGALQAARDGDVEQGRIVLREAIGAGSASAQQLGDPRLAEQVRDMKALASELDGVAKVDPLAGIEDANDPAVPAVSPVAKTPSARRAHSNALQNFRPRRAQ